MSLYNEVGIKEFESLGFNGKNKVRLLKINKDVILDIREYIISDAYTGFTRRGIRLSWDDIQALLRILPEVEEIMDKTK